MEGEDKSKNTDTSTKTDKLGDKEFEGRNRYLIISLDYWKSRKFSEISITKSSDRFKAYMEQQL